MKLRRAVSLLGAVGIVAGVNALPVAAGAAGLAPPPPSGVISKPMPQPDETASGSSGTTHVVWSDGDNNADLTPGSTATLAWTRTCSPQTCKNRRPVPPPTPAAADSCAGTGPWQCTYPWNFFQGRNYVPNGTYTVSVTAQVCDQPFGCSDGTTTSQPFTVSNPPVAPQNVTATLVTGSSTGVTTGSTSSTTSPGKGVKITWDANPEPDLVGYAVFRVHDGAAEGKAFSGCSVGYQTTSPPPCPTQPSVTDASSGGGTFSYRVVALRWGITWDPVQSVPSKPSSASNQVTVPGMATTTTTTTAPSSSDGGAFAVFGTATRSFSGSGFSSSPSFSGFSTGVTIDRGFQSELPFGSTAGESGEPGDQGQSSADGPAVKAPFFSHSKRSVGPMALAATGLLLLVVAMGGLWLRRQVKRAGILEPLEPEL